MSTPTTGIATTTLRYVSAGVDVTLGLDEAGSGRSVVLLPALSSISTRAEMQPLLERLAAHCCVRSVDWPGFGDRPRPRLDLAPRMLAEFLSWLLQRLAAPPHVVVAAGHAATYALCHAVQHPGAIDRLVLVAPTWRGPLPTMMNGTRPWFATVRGVIDRPGLGVLLYRLNVSPFMVKAMARGHVYEDPAWLTDERLGAKLAVTRASGARHGSVRFVTGALDPVGSRQDFLELARRAAVPILLIYGASIPPRSRAEMEQLAALPGVRSDRLPRGKLSLHEEFPDEVAGLVLSFLAEGAPQGQGSCTAR